MTAPEAKAPIVIRNITSLPEMREVEELQKQVWGVNDLEVFPALALIPMTEVGAILIGAFDGERMVGFVFGFPGYESFGATAPAERGNPVLHSDMLAVRTEYRAHGLGYRLKLAQREQALVGGIDTITWTYDPLQSLNAHLNITRLGATAVSYRIDYYGKTTSFLHGAGTDRLWVTWALASERVRQRIGSGPTLPAPLPDDLPFLVHVGPGTEPVIKEIDLDSQPVVIEIPGDINVLLKEDPALAIKWRAATRHVLSNAFDAGYVVVEFFRGERNERKIGQYLLLKNWTA